MLGRERRESRERCGRAKPQHGPRGAPSTRTVPGRVKEATGEDRQDWHGGTSSNGAVGGGKRQSRSARKRVDRARLLIGAQAWFTLGQYRAIQLCGYRASQRAKVAGPPGLCVAPRSRAPEEYCDSCGGRLRSPSSSTTTHPPSPHARL